MNIFQQAIFAQGRRRASADVAPAGPELLALSGVLALYRADVGVTDTGGVVLWEDQSPHGFDLTTTNGPAFVVSSSKFNDHPAMSFDGANDILKNVYITTTAGALGEQSGFTVAIFIAPKNTNSAEQILNWGSADDNAILCRQGWSGRSENDQFEHTLSLSGSYYGKIMADAHPFNITGSYSVVYRYTKQVDGPIEVWTNGVEGTKQIDGVSSTVSNKFAEGPFFLGAHVSETAFGEFDIAELVIINNNVSAADMAVIVDYGASRYGIPSGAL